MSPCISRFGSASELPRRAALATLCLAALTGVAQAQADSARADSTAGTVLGSVWRALTDTGRAPWLRPTASLLVPGTGQLLAGDDRAALYFVLEAALVTRFLSLHSEGRRERNRFRELAFTVARAPFQPSTRDTVFEYFEQMQAFIESGSFDTDPGPDLVPPLDERTFNGSIWALARQTFFTNPDSMPAVDSEEYRRAIEFYRARAVGPNFLWSWRDAGLERDLFAQAIRQSDEAFRRATRQLGLLLANHLLSAVDAFVSHRLSRTGREIQVSSAVGIPGGDDRLRGLVMVRVGF